MTTGNQRNPTEQPKQTSDNERAGNVQGGPAEQVPEAGTGRGGLSGGAEPGHTGAGIAGSDVDVGGINSDLVGGPEGGDSDMPAAPQEKSSGSGKADRR